MQLDPGIESIQDALREIVRAAGGAKAVGAKLYPTKPIAQAAQRVNDSLNPEHQQHFSDNEVFFLLRLGREVGCHTGMQYLAQACHYSEPTPVESADDERPCSANSSPPPRSSSSWASAWKPLTPARH